jgi:hypothetical protein
MGSLGTLDQTRIPAKEGIVAMLLVYSFGWSVGSAPLTYVLSAELPSPALRENTVRVAYSVKLVIEYVYYLLISVDSVTAVVWRISDSLTYYSGLLLASPTHISSRRSMSTLAANLASYTDPSPCAHCYLHISVSPRPLT